MKYLVAGLLLAGLSVPAMAQTSQADIDAITKVIVDAKGDAIATKDQVKAFKKTYKKDATAIAALGRAFLEAKNYQMAEEIANLAIKANGKSAEGYILLGDIASAQDDGGKAAGYYEQGTYYEPANPTSYVRYATVYQKVDPDGAVAMLEKLRAVKPDYPVDAAAGRMYSRNGQLKSAMSHYDKVADPTTIEDYILFDYALTAYALEEYDKAVSLAQKGIQKYPNYKSPNEILGYTYYNMSMWNNAIACFEKVEQEYYFFMSDIYWMLAWSSGKIKNYVDEEKYYRLSYELAPEIQFTLNNLGYSLYKQKKYLEAKEIFKQCLEAKKDLPCAANNYVRVLIALGRNVDAKKFVNSGEFKVAKAIRDRVKKLDNHNARLKNMI